MAVSAFPNLKPTARTWTPGVQPMSNFTSMSGYEVRVMVGPDPIGTALQLTFENSAEADIRQITDHYVLAKGMFEVFSLPAETFAGMTTYGQVTPSGFSWRYAGPPSIEWLMPGVGSVSVSLVAVRD
jgi:hypothetical protein